ncbi:MAG TPA: RNA polymerase factor sigma-54 [Firmicutes bacterium]|jgi:RNA polymerase sigma-54 factor|nr:RNA polymerase factor sigma-54 [Bacillota bacterium]
MRMAFRLNIEQSQRLIMTPELRQAITVLQLSALELSEYIEQELLENPLLEMENGTTDDGAAAGEEEPYDLDWQEYFADTSDLGYINRSAAGGTWNPEYSFEHFLSRESTLYEHLLWQLHLNVKDGPKQQLGEFILGNLDENGYLTCSPAELARLQGVTEGEVREVLEIIKTFDPPGVGAADLKECLLLQVKALDIEYPLLELLINSYLPDLAQGRLMRVAGELGVSVQEIQAAGDILRTLDPKPGRRFGPVPQGTYIVPDVVVEKVGDDYVIIVSDVTSPRLTINSNYRNILQARDAEDQARAYIESKLNSARWLIKSIEQRRITVYKIVETLVQFQRDFFDRGVRYLKPLTLKQVAEVVGVHESTVSRATSNKFIQTPRGVFPLRFFFASGVENTEGSSTSSESIKRMLQELLEREEPSKPYSDQKLADILRERGIMISRRTVAKYRHDLGIPPSNCRRRY